MAQLPIDKFVEKKQQEIRKGKRTTVWGIVLTVLGIAGVSHGTSIMIIVLVIGIFVWIVGAGGKMTAVQSIACMQHLNGRQKMSLDELAALTNSSYSSIKITLEHMIKNSELPGARIDAARREIILEEDASAETPAPDAEYGPEMVVVECPNCQAPNAVRRGGIGVCEYCGQKISG